ncbi:MAG TPA: hypothetical protein VGO90_17610 [Chthoniobacteraceae bacterium]|jgi:hypothetical protein|nr:hypothetical protein [Chthoniobacter sp.]HEV7869511.1 hypothetical protein [Chthoniobacteraceae bacterium]
MKLPGSCLAILLLLVVVARAAESVPQIKAKTEEPVIEEMLGGCSLRCSFQWTVEAQPGAGGKMQPTTILNDESAQTAWVAPEPTTGVGAKFRLSFPDKIPAEMEGQTPFYGLDLINGFWKTEELWKEHARIKKVRLYYNRKPFRDVAFVDSRRWQRVTWPDIMIRSGDSLTVEVLEIYPGTKAGLAVTELVLEGAH